MKRKSMAIALITALLCMVAGGSVACTTVVVDYHLSISSTDGGDVTEPGEGRFSYCPQQGERVKLVATPDFGYRFVNWSGDVDAIADVNRATTTITVNDDYSITANFAKLVKQYHLTISSTNGGSVTTPGEGTFAFDEGTVVSLVAGTDAGNRFVNWTGDVGTIGNVNSAITSITMNDDYSITAHFVKQYSLTVSSTQGGSVTTPGEGTYTYDEGQVVNLVAIPDICFRFVNWLGDVSTIADVSAATTTITMNDDYAVTAKFVSLCERC